MTSENLGVVSTEHCNFFFSVAKFVNQRGRVSVAELMDYSNKLIGLQSWSARKPEQLAWMFFRSLPWVSFLLSICCTNENVKLCSQMKYCICSYSRVWFLFEYSLAKAVFSATCLTFYLFSFDYWHVVFVLQFGRAEYPLAFVLTSIDH